MARFIISVHTFLLRKVFSARCIASSNAHGLLLVSCGLFLLISSTVIVGYGNYRKSLETPTVTATQ
jgi:hypothetical protein